MLTQDQRLETRKVTTGITNNVDIQILSGPKAGENRGVVAARRQAG